METIFTSYGSSTRFTVQTSPTFRSRITSANGVMFDNFPFKGSASTEPTILKDFSWFSDKSKIVT